MVVISLEMVGQVLLAILGCLSLYTVTHKEASVRRYGAVFGLAAEPFWLYSAWDNQQWGIFFLCGIYSFRWAQVLYRDFRR
jgi:threonine/homoserine efflux transporter RhtA